MNIFEKYNFIAGYLNRIFQDSREILRKEYASMGRKENYSFRLSKKAKSYIEYCASVSGLSESKFVDFLMCSLAAQDEGFKLHCENEKANFECRLSNGSVSN